MSIPKTSLPTEASPRAITASVGAKTISTVTTYKEGSVYVIELNFSDSTTTFIKVAANQGIEIGGTADMGTGTKVIW